MDGLKLGPQGFTKIALLGSAADSIGLAPFNDPSWAIWVCSPGAFAVAAQRRSDVYFETHRFQPSAPGRSGEAGTRPHFSPEFHQFLREHKGPVFMSAVDPTIPNSVRIPFEALIEKYGPYFFTSSISWMLALAIEQMPQAIGLWGIDMSSTEEWNYQRPACQHFVGMAKALGIEVILPPESDLMRPGLIYGLGEINPRHIKLSARLDNFHKQRGACRAQIQQLQQQDAYLSGAIDDATYIINTWCDDIAEPDLAQAMSYSAQYHARPKGITTVLDATDTTGASVLTLGDRKEAKA